MYLGSTRTGAGLALAMALVLSVALSGCGDSNLGTDAGWFRKPMDVFGRSAGYTFSDTQETRLQKPITDADLIDANGGCAAQPAAAPQPSNQSASPAAAPGAAPSEMGEGVGLGMSECEVVSRAGAPNNIQIGKAPNGDRTAVLTYDSGPRPGIYRFERGRLMQLDRVDVPALAPPPKTAKKKPAKPKKQAANNNAT